MTPSVPQTGKNFHTNPAEALGGSSNPGTRRMHNSVDDSGELTMENVVQSSDLLRVASGCPYQLCDFRKTTEYFCVSDSSSSKCG